MAEARVQADIRLQCGLETTLYRNNVGAYKDNTGRLVRYGLCKGSSDLVGDKTITITIRNASGRALGRVAWDAIFKMSPWTNPANGHNRSVVLCFDGTHWLQIMQAGVDVPN